MAGKQVFQDEASGENTIHGWRANAGKGGRRGREQGFPEVQTRFQNSQCKKKGRESLDHHAALLEAPANFHGGVSAQVPIEIVVSGPKGSESGNGEQEAASRVQVADHPVEKAGLVRDVFENIEGQDQIETAPQIDFAIPWPVMDHPVGFGGWKMFQERFDPFDLPERLEMVEKETVATADVEDREVLAAGQDSGQ